ncbi:hypothetical protein [Massilia niastensis]|uniref:hypothetical protein n=1 Tax=Massilia niastensis TaxID=544911 RepID=UPI00039C3501|nr:hypothetical protein [Massilia niastensis]
MRDLRRRRPGSRLAFLALLAALFLLFTPFEQGGPNPSMFPKYFAAGASVLALLPLFILTRMRVRVESQLVLVALAMVAFHALVVDPVPFHFVLLVVLNLALAVFLYEASFTWREEFVSALSWLLLVNAAVITLQALLFHLIGGPIVDFHKMIFGSDSRFIEDFLNIARFPGLQVEPGTYANYIGCLAAILMLSSAFSVRFLLMCFMAVMSVFVTNSGSSIYFVPVLIVLLGYLWRSRVRAIHLVVLIAAVLVYMHVSGVMAHLEERFFERDDGSLSHRIEGVHIWMAMSLEEKLIGVGFGADPCVRCHYQDIGMVFNLLTRGGLIVTLAFAVMLGRMVLANGPVLALLLILIPVNEKMFFYETPAWLFFLFAMTPHIRNLSRQVGVAAGAPDKRGRRCSSLHG